MLALRVPARRAAWNARSWDPARQVGELLIIGEIY